jgi:hypothetical protein
MEQEAKYQFYCDIFKLPPSIEGPLPRKKSHLEKKPHLEWRCRGKGAQFVIIC